MKLKTLHITNSWHPQSGGIRTFYLALLDAANAAGQPMHLVVPSAEDRTEVVGSHGVIHHVKAPYAPGSHSYRIIYPHQYLRPAGRVNIILQRERPDLVEFCDKYTLNYLGGALRVGLVPGINFRPVVVGLSCEPFTESMRNYLYGGPASAWLVNTYLRWLYFPLADHHVAVSRFVADELAAISDNHKVDRSVWLGPMGVDYAYFAQSTTPCALRQQLLARLGACAHAVLLLFAGRMAREKNIPLLLATAKELEASDPSRDYRLVLAGDGDDRAALESAAQKLKPGAALFLGFQNKAELAQLFHACDIFLHANPREPFGIGPLEAMAAGLPLVAPNTGGVTTYANTTNAWLATPAPQHFAKAIHDVVGNPAARSAKVERAKATAQSYDWSFATGRFLEMYREIYHRARSRASHSVFEPLFTSTPYARSSGGAARVPH